MKTMGKIAIVAALVAAVGGVLAVRYGGGAHDRGQAAATSRRGAAPRLLDLGSDKCLACKMMVPVLEGLRSDYAGSLQVDFIDVHKDEAAAEAYDVWVIPTQIFFDASGRERFRHEGFMDREAIVAKWKELGVELAPAGTPAEPGLQHAMAWLFGGLSRAVEGAPAAALAAAFVWGVLSVLLSPCHLASIPLIVGFVNGQGRISTARAFLISTLFSAGILITIAAIGAVTAAAGRMMGLIGGWANAVVAVVFFVVGLHLLDVIPMPWSGPGQVAMKRKGTLAALVLGLVFGIALGPCTFAYMAPMLGITFRIAAASVAYGIVLLAVYGVGHCSVIVLAGTSTEVVQRYLNWNQRSRGAVVLKRLCGVLVLTGGLYLVYTAA